MTPEENNLFGGEASLAYVSKVMPAALKRDLNIDTYEPSPHLARRPSPSLATCSPSCRNTLPRPIGGEGCGEGVHLLRHRHHVPRSRERERVAKPGECCGENAALKHGRNGLGVESDPAYCQQAASRLLNENTNLFGNAQLQIELKPHAAIEAVAALQETAPGFKARDRRKAAGIRS